MINHLRKKIDAGTRKMIDGAQRRLRAEGVGQPAATMRARLTVAYSFARQQPHRVPGGALLRSRQQKQELALIAYERGTARSRISGRLRKARNSPSRAAMS